MVSETIRLAGLDWKYGLLCSLEGGDKWGLVGTGGVCSAGLARQNLPRRHFCYWLNQASTVGLRCTSPLLAGSGMIAVNAMSLSLLMADGIHCAAPLMQHLLQSVTDSQGCEALRGLSLFS